MYLGLKQAVSELGVSLITVVGGDLDNPQFNNSRRNRVFDLLNADDFDGVIFQSGSLVNYVTEEQFLKFCSRFNTIPSVHIGFNRPGHSSVVIDNVTGMKELIDHFIEVHNRTKIAFIRGPVSSTDAEERYNAYCESLQQHGIPLNEDYVFIGNFLPESGPAAIKEFVDNKKIHFDALVGSNDQMALYAMNELLRRGIRIPKDVLIGGFDNLISARACSPAMTTVSQSVFELGKSALNLLVDIIDGKKAPGSTVFIPSRLILRRSCGCISPPVKQSDSDDADKTGNVFIEKQIINLFKTDQSSVTDTLANQIISFLKNGFEIDDLMSSLGQILDKHIQEIPPHILNDIRRMMLTISEEQFEIRQLRRQEEEDQLYNFVDDLRKLSEPDALREFLHAKLINIGIKEFYISRYKDSYNSILFYNNLSDEYGTVFRSNQLIPNGISSLHSSFNLVCMPLFETDSDIGFVITNPTDTSPVFLETIRSSLCGTLQIMDMMAKQREYGVSLEKKVQIRTAELQQALNNLSEANEKLEQISVRDELTGLLNRRGFMSMASMYISLAKRNLSSFICIYFDLDNLKQINDSYGHAHGDIAIKAIADILNKAFRKTDVVGRMGGDEFTALALDCTESSYDLILKRMDLLVEEYNSSNNNPWILGYSSGLASSSQEHGFDIDTLLKLADQALYEIKQKKKKKREGA
jgi:diguanylate cyclase (GGDEF)-like protein